MAGKASTDKELALVEKCIIRTMRRFRESPKSFWSEDDIRCHMKQLLLKGRHFKIGKQGNVFLSFPTKNTYERRDDSTLSASTSGKNDFFDLAGWASQKPTTWNHSSQSLSFAIELKYFAAIPGDWAVQIRNDLMKLSDEANGVPPRGRFFLLLTNQATSRLRETLNTLFAEFPSVRCYQQIAQ